MVLFRFASHEAKVLGAVLGGGHALFFLVMMTEFFGSQLDAQWQLAWVPWILIDFPVSVLTWLSLFEMPRIYLDYLPKPFSNFTNFTIPFCNHLILGSIQWLFIPLCVSHLRNRKKE